MTVDLGQGPEVDMQRGSMFAPLPRTGKRTRAMHSEPWTTGKRWTMIAPVVLILTTLAVFQVTKSAADMRVAPLTGFVYYWIVGGIIIPLVTLGRAGYSALFAGPRVEGTMTLRLAILALFVPAGFGFLFAFPYFFPADTGVLLSTLALYALVNGTLEEVFWRGLFITQFRSNPWFAVVYPGVLFGLWQLVPWTLFESWLRPSALVVLAVSIPMGLLYGWVARQTGSIRVTTLAHVLTNLSGIGALLIFAPAG